MNPDEKWIEVPETLLSEVARQLDPRPGDRKYGPDCTTAVNRNLITAVIEYFDGADLFCDHEVNICSCAALALLQELRLLLDGEMTCRTCGGDTYIWSDEEYQRRMAELGPTEYDAQEYGNVVCPTCNGAGITRIKKEAAQ